MADIVMQATDLRSSGLLRFADGEGVANGVGEPSRERGGGDCEDEVEDGQSEEFSLPERILKVGRTCPTADTAEGENTEVTPAMAGQRSRVVE